VQQPLICLILTGDRRARGQSLIFVPLTGAPLNSYWEGDKGWTVVGAKTSLAQPSMRRREERTGLSTAQSERWSSTYTVLALTNSPIS